MSDLFNISDEAAMYLVALLQPRKRPRAHLCFQLPHYKITSRYKLPQTRYIAFPYELNGTFSFEDYVFTGRLFCTGQFYGHINTYKDKFTAIQIPISLRESINDRKCAIDISWNSMIYKQFGFQSEIIFKNIEVNEIIPIEITTIQFNLLNNNINQMQLSIGNNERIISFDIKNNTCTRISSCIILDTCGKRHEYILTRVHGESVFRKFECARYHSTYYEQHVSKHSTLCYIPERVFTRKIRAYTTKYTYHIFRSIIEYITENFPAFVLAIFNSGKYNNVRLANFIKPAGTNYGRQKNQFTVIKRANPWIMYETDDVVQI